MGSQRCEIRHTPNGFAPALSRGLEGYHGEGEVGNTRFIMDSVEGGMGVVILGRQALFRSFCLSPLHLAQM